MNTSAQLSTSLQTVSVTELPASTLATAIRSPSDHGEILRRTNSVLSLYFDPDLDPQTKAELRQEFVIALDAFPNWATQRAFDVWVKDAKRRPAPGDIVALAEKQIKTITDEITRRDRISPPAIESSRERVSKEAAAAIMAQAGFAPKRMDAAE